ncbi:SICAvar, type I [Plasmodium knowlesi strain H]|uniref:SICAvar, type I n=3 Tax=Plasmodium knowlesi TaxID=5850 RepID=A0A5E7X2V9_PLAKH|nr:SICAvar, type I [Plasmodium knowlesi strain H]OTN67220.1 SICAvar type I [Plasmodium knowlesi]CAA9988718.1 SICAvar, type I [Plasmodium knowlesi strain H]SBO21669.1 SICAvar, type I [Plasmodium knowlesi strain H]SBO22025.1 SICAvar, type I [Plasmodium knowlesi strain H]VVS78192.1 SICAvar, type I [Plasmodium knowlesi strain H]
MAAGAAGATSPNSCPAEGDPERTKSEQKGKELRDRWKEELGKLRKQWQLSHTSTQGGTVPSVPEGFIPDGLKIKVKTMLDTLKPYLDGTNSGGTVARACENMNDPRGNRVQKTREMKNVCKTLVQVVNWMGNLEKEGKKKTNGSTPEEDWQKYLRCVIGYEFLLRVLLPKYKVEDFMKVISDTMEKGGSDGKVSSGNAICPWVKIEDIGDKEGSIGSQVQEWLNEAKEQTSSGYITGFNTIVAWSRPDKGQEEQEMARRKSKPPCQSDSIMDLMKAGLSHQLNVLVDPLAKANDCIEKAQTDNSGSALCNRLKCIEDYLKSQNKTTPPTTPPPPSPGSQPQAGQPSPTDEFWGETGDVYKLWNELTKKMKGNGTNGPAECNNLTTNSEKMACKYLHAGLKQLYDPTPPPLPSSPDDGILSTKHPSFRQTMGCFLLHAYAKHMQKESVCNIEKGIEKAFSTAGNGKTGTACSGSGNTCIPCKWELNKYDSCTIDTNGQGQTEHAGAKVEKLVKEDDPEIKKMAIELNKKEGLCRRFQCISEKWLKKGRSNSEPLTSTDWDRVRSRGTSQVEDLSRALGDATSRENRKKYEQYCQGIPTGPGGRDADKDACILIAAGLKSLYDIKEDTAKGIDAVTASFRRTMQCVLLNAFADKLEKLPCKEERSVTEGINAAFGKSGTIKDASSDCKGDKCFKCERFKTYKSCTIKENNTVDSKGEKLHEEIDPKLADNGLTNNTSSLLTSSLIKTICKPCTGDKSKKFCDQLTCVAEKWDKRKNGKSNGTPSWENMEGDFGTELKALLDGMKKPDNQNAVAKNYCNADKDGKTWEDGAAGVANKIACQLVAAGLKHISSIQFDYNASSNPNPYDNQEFKQFVSCLMLKGVVQKMKEQSPICDIQPGIDAAFKVANEIKGKHCINKKPCTVCKWTDEEYDKLKECQIGNKDNDIVKPKLEALLDEKKTEVDNTLMDITITAGNASSYLCRRLQCLASQVQALATSNGPSKSNVNDFWTTSGEVGTLWNQLSLAMTTEGKRDQNGCTQMDDGSAGGTATGTTRTATDPERKACNYLHAGLTELYKKTSSTAAPSSSGNDDKILDKNPLLRQTVGCLLLHAYAKKMKSEAKCLVESGIKKAFESHRRGLISNCHRNGKEPCVLCHWNEEDYEGCKINTTSTNKEDAKTKVEGIVTAESVPQAMEDINKMTTLCDYIKCAAPNWFKSKLSPTTNGGVSSGTTPTKTWCDFWEKEGVKPTLQSMFQHMESEGKDTSKNSSNVVCQQFGDGNEHSVERKACNHITAGLQHIKGITGDPNGAIQINNAQAHDKFFKQSMMCAALNLYATKIRDASEAKCPIDENTIQRMFEKWNDENKNSCPTSGSGGSNNVCFECKREANFSSCNLLVDKDLIAKPQSGASANCNDNDKKDVPKKMDELLKQESKMQTTLEKINKMDTFCSELQCAAKQYHKNKQNGVQPKPPLSWNDISKVVEEELKKLLEKITNEGNWKKVATYCKEDIGSSWSGDTPGEKKAKQKACKLFASGLKHISDINNDKTKEDGPLKKTMMCAALNLYADQLISKSTKQCPLDDKKLGEAVDHAFQQYNATMQNGTPPSCPSGSTNSCFICNRGKDFHNCRIGNNPNDKVGDRMTKLITDNDKINTTNNTTPNMEQTLDKINSKDTFCTQVQCAIKQHYRTKNGQSGVTTTPKWNNIEGDAKGVLAQLLSYMTESNNQRDAAEYCNDDNKWSKFGHKGKHTNKAACLLFAAGLKNIYVRGKGSPKVNVKDPSFEQTMGCLFLKEYAKQLQTMANEKKKGHSWVHPLCEIDKGIDHAFKQSKDIMKSVLDECKNGTNGISCFECEWAKDDYDDCKIGTDSVKTKVESVFKDDQSKQTQMKETLENTVCPILLTDLLTPFLPLAPVSIGLSAMAYYLWKYFGPLGKGGARFRRSPAEIRGPSVQEQVLDHVEEAGPHEYRLVKERKPRSAPTRTKRSGPVNRRTIIEIHFEVLDECQKGDTQLNQKDFLELLVQEFMGSEFMEEEQVPKELVPMEGVPIEEVPSLGSVFMV